MLPTTPRDYPPKTHAVKLKFFLAAVCVRTYTHTHRRKVDRVGGLGASAGQDDAWIMPKGA